jgi:hypothetical protein
MTNTKTLITPASAKRAQILYGVVLIVLGLLIYLLFVRTTEAGVTTTFGLNLANAQAIKVPDLVVPAQATVLAMAAIAIFVGAYQLARGIPSTSYNIYHCIPDLVCTG